MMEQIVWLSMREKSIFWPKLNRDIQEFCMKYVKCEEFRRAQLVPIKTWKQPQKFFQRIHIDVATIFNQYIVVCQDVFSDIAFLENFERHSINEITEFLMNIFKNYGFPDELVSDGGKELVQFGKLWTEWGIKYTSTPIEHQNSNGQAERLVQTVKNKL